MNGFTGAPCGHPCAAKPVVDNSSSLTARLRIRTLAAWGLLDSLSPQPGCWVLQSAASSTVGRMVIQAAALKEPGYRTA